MKKFSIALLAFLYLAVSSGFAMNIHYCMGKISSIDLVSSKDKCGKCGMKKGNGGCCKDEVKIVKLSDSHKLISNEVNFPSPGLAFNNHYNIFNTALFYSTVKSPAKNNSPPGSSGIPLNILHCVFRV